MSTNTSIDKIKTVKNQLIETLLKKINKSIIFADLQFTEWLHLTCGLENLVKLGGAFNIKEFSSFQTGDDYLKGVFFTSYLIDDNRIKLEILQDIIKSSKFQYVILILNDTLIDDVTGGDCIDQLKDDILIWMGNANYTCEIFVEKFPFLYLPSTQHTSKLNITINYLNVFSNSSTTTTYLNDINHNIVSFETYNKLIKHDLNEQTQQQHQHGGLNSLTSSLTSKDTLSHFYQYLSKTQLNELKNVAYSIHQMLDHLDAKDDCYTLGVLSKLISNELNHLQATKQRRKSATNKVSILLVDRNLDLTMPTLYHDETVFDKMNNLFDTLNNTSNDIKFNLYDFLFDNKIKDSPNGCFFHTNNDTCEHLIEQIMLTKPKECLLEVYRKLTETFPNASSSVNSGENVNKSKQLANRISRITVDTVKTQIKNQIKNKPESLFENLNLIQIIALYCLTCDNQLKNDINYDNLISYMKVITQKLLDKDDASILSQLYQVFHDDFERDDESRKYTIIDLMMLIVYVYSLIGEECFYGIEEESRMKKLIINELNTLKKNLKRRKIELNFFNQLNLDENKSIDNLVENFFDRIKQINKFSSNLKQFNKLLFTNDATMNSVVEGISPTKQQQQQQHGVTTYKPLIKQLCEYLLKTNSDINNQSEQFVDIEYRTTTEGIKDLFKSFKFGSYLGSQTKTNHPLNNDVLIIYMIGGGITSYEMKIVREAFSKSNYKVFIGSSNICNHKKLLNYLIN